MIPSDVTLSPGARATCSRLGVPEPALQRARVASASEMEQPTYLVIYGQLEDGRTILMSCQHDRPWHIISVRLANGS